MKIFYLGMDGLLVLIGCKARISVLTSMQLESVIPNINGVFEQKHNERIRFDSLYMGEDTVSRLQVCGIVQHLDKRSKRFVILHHAISK